MPIFPPRVEFVGVDVSTRGGTLPAQACTPWVIAKTCWYSGCVSVYWLWPILCTINSQFLALDFCTSQYYTGHDCSQPVGNLWTPLAQAEFDDTWKSILDDPCIKRFDSTIKLVILRIAFSSFGFAGASFNLEMMQHLFPQLRIIKMAKAFHLWGLAGGTSSSILRRSPNLWQRISVALSPRWRFLERLWY